MLTNTTKSAGQVVVLRGPASPTSATADPPGRVIRFGQQDVDDVYDILSVGSRVVIRR